MSTYQYYEFQAIDRPLDAEKMSVLRAISTRAVITATSFTNTYHWGDLKADPEKLLAEYFDAFLYVANWGSHWLSFRVPADAVDISAISAYETEESFVIIRKGAHVVLRFCSDTESEDWEEGDVFLASLISLRADILRGDYRALYIAWLYDAQCGLVYDEEVPPPAPLGMAELSAPLRSLVDFLRVDDDLIIAAGESSAPLPKQTPESQQDWRAWIQSLDEADKDELLYRVASGDAVVQWELQKRFRQHADRAQGCSPTGFGPRRPVSDLLAARDERVERRRQQQAKADERMKRQQQAARRAYLEGLTGREDSFRDKISTLIATVQQSSYDNAVRFLVDLRDAAALRGDAEAFGEYLSGLRNKHARKPSLIRRLDKAGL